MAKKYIVKVNGNEYEVEVEEVRENGVPVVEQAQVKQTSAPVAKAPKKSTKSANALIGASKILAPMPGTILSVDVSEGDQVEQGQVLLILEAMKMENEITAPVTGKIATVNVSKGDSVNAGDIMISIG